MDIREGESVDPWEMEVGGRRWGDCILIGAADDRGRVEWFQVLDGWWPGGLVHVGSAVELAEDGTVLVSHGYRFTLDEDVAIDCPSERYRDVAHLVEERPGLQEALIELRTGEIVEMNCISDH